MTAGMMSAETIAKALGGRLLGAAAGAIHDRVQAPLAICGHVKHGRFPKPVRLGPKTTEWRVQEIRALFAQLGQ
jgi:hypothetical protein